MYTCGTALALLDVRLGLVLGPVVHLDHEVVGDGADEPAHVRHQPRDPEKPVARREHLASEARHVRQQAAGEERGRIVLRRST